MDPLGTTPYFSTRVTAMSHQPPSGAGMLNHSRISRLSRGWSARRTISFKKRLAFSSLSQNCR